MKPTPLENWIVDKSAIKQRNRKALEAYQLNKIRETVHYARNNSRFYGWQLKSAGDNELHSLEDLQNIPFTYPYQIKQKPLDFLCVPHREIKRIVTLKSSGTSGAEKRIYFTEEDLDLTIDFFKHGMSCLTDETDRVMVLLPGNTYGSIGDLLKKALDASKIECSTTGVLVDPEETAKCIIEKNITCIVGIPMQVLYLSRVKSELFHNKIKKVLLSTDYVPEVLIKELTQQNGCKVFTHYGMTEMGYGGGVECEALDGYHMREADLYFEIIHPDTGEAVQEGQFGEVVFTTLTRQAMPLIRYRTGDIAAFSSTSCACGTFLKTMKRVSGRKDNKVCIRDKKFIYLKELDETVLPFKEVLDYKAYIMEDEVLNIEIAAKSNETVQIIKSEIVKSVQACLFDRLENNIKVQITTKLENKPDKITNSMLKRKLYDLRNELKAEG